MLIFKPTTFRIIFLGIIILILPSTVSADYLGQKVTFFVDSSYDISLRSQVSATLKRIFARIYFYVEDDWWNSLSGEEQSEINSVFNDLSEEFDSNIYPILTSTFGEEWKPGIDKDERITILLHPMKKEAGGYFNSADEYDRLQVPSSNQREMIYFNTDYITSPLAESHLAHEFVHLITFNQKDKRYYKEEETWLNEGRAEYAPTLIGYDSEYEGSSLQERVKAFIKNPSDPIVEWKNKVADYGVVNLFLQYLVDHYGVKILSDSLHCPETGISSINYALEKNGFEQDFSRVFSDWTIAVLVNNCSLGKRYCYLNENLRNLKIVPSSYYIPLSEESILSTFHAALDFSGNWHRIVGGKGSLSFEFDGEDQALFRVPYVLCDKQGERSLYFLDLDENQDGRILIPDFDTIYASFTLIPSVQKETPGSSYGFGPSFSWKATTVAKQEEVEEEIEEEKPIEEMSVEELEAKIAQIIALIAQLKVQLAELTGSAIYEGIPSGFEFETNLFYGMRNNDVRYLQEFLKSQGKDIYPEGLVTGNFLSWTKAAVIRFQEKYQEEILGPWELTKGTGFVGTTTRAQLNELLAGTQ